MNEAGSQLLTDEEYTRWLSPSSASKGIAVSAKVGGDWVLGIIAAQVL